MSANIRKDPRLPISLALMLLFVLGTTIGASRTLNGQVPERTWVDTTGSFKIKARVIKVDSATVHLFTKERTIEVPIDKLSAPDVKFAEAYRLKKIEAEQLCQQAIDFISKGLNDPAVQILKDTSKLDANNTNADFLQGLICYFVGKNYEDSERHFKKCVDRYLPYKSRLTKLEQGNYVAALNNLALLSVRNRQPKKAITYWGKALQTSEQTPQEIVQNIGTFTRFLQTNLSQVNALQIYVSLETKRAVNSMVKDVKLGADTKPWRPNVGWEFMSFAKHSTTKKKKSDDDDTDFVLDDDDRPIARPKTVVPAGSGSGSYIGNRMILTNRHIVSENGRPYPYFEVKFGPDYDVAVSARAVVFSAENDIALIETARPLDVPKFTIYDGLPEIGSDVRAYGFPFGGATFGLALTASGGSVMRHPATKGQAVAGALDVAKSLWHDCILNGGNSGGPLVSNNGTIVGVNFAVVKVGLNPVNLAVDSSTAASFAKRFVPDVTIVNDLNIQRNIKTLEPSVVYISIFEDSLLSRPPQRTNRLVLTRPRGEWEDVSCFACRGDLKAPCPNRNCVKGSYVEVRLVKNRANQFVQQKVRVTCDSCKGKGFLPCASPAGKCEGVDFRFLGDE